MRILQVNFSFSGGGAATLVRALASAATAAGHVVGEAGIIRSFTSANAWFPLGRVPAGTTRWARMERWASLVANPAKLLDVSRGIEDHHCPASRRLLRLADGWDVVHLHNLHGSPAWFDLRILPELCRLVPVVLTLHDAWALTGHCSHPMECGRWRTGCGECPDLAIYPPVRRDGTATGWARKKSIFDHARLQVVGPSRWILDAARSSLVAGGAAGWHHIPNGIDTAIFHPRGRADSRKRLGLPPEVPVVSFVAMGLVGNPFKDWPTLQRALELIGQEPGAEILVLAIGDRAPARRLGRVRVEFIPPCADPAFLADHYRSSDIYVHAARADTFPYTVLEAQACGTPVVASAVGGIPEQVDARGGESCDAVLVPPRDPRALAAGISRLLADADLRREYGDRAAVRVAAAFDLAACNAQYLRLYAEVARSQVR